MATVLNHMPDEVLLYDLKSKSIRVNQGLYKLFDIKNHDIHTHLVIGEISRQLQSVPSLKMNFPERMFSKKNEIYQEVVSNNNQSTLIHSIRLEKPVPYVIWLFKKHESNENHSLLKLNQIDALTSLPTRSMFSEAFLHFKEQHQRYGHMFAVCYIDLDDFKIINDTLGHEAGNYVLQVISKRLLDMIGQEHFICRMGGDEFLAIIGQLSYKSDSDKYIERIIDAFKTPIHIQDIPYFLSASIGVSFYPCDAKEQNALITHADCAMYESKTKGKNTYAYYKPYQSMHMQSKLKLQQMIRSGIKSHEFYFEFQPIISTNKPNTLKFEELSRWSKGISPGIYIPMAEEMNIIHQLCMQHLHKSIEYIQFINTYCDKDIEISFNISSRQINNQNHRQELIEFIRHWPSEYGQIELEITETSLVNIAFAQEFIQAAHQYGAKIALDDFGTGFSGFKQIQDLAFDNIKIDRSFISTLDDPQHTESKEILQKLIKIITKIGAHITVEGVETESQLKICHTLGSHYIQGFYISKPISLKDLIQYSKSN